ncbi:hypothetical protein D9M69_409980 [compost metagenome]
MRQVLAGEDQRARAIVALDGGFPGHGGFHRVGRAPGVQVRGAAQAGELLDRLVGRAVFTQADGVVGVDEEHALLHQRGHAHGVAGVFHEHQEGRAVGDETTVQGDAVHDGAHAELANAIEQVVAGGVLCGHALAAFPQGQVGAGQVSRAAEEFRQQRTEGVQGVLAGLAAGDGFALGGHFGDIGVGLGGEVGRQLALDAALEFRGQLRVSGGIGGETLVPGRFAGSAGGLGVPLGIDLGRDFEGRVGPAQGSAGQGDFVVTQRCAVALFLALLVRRAEADHGLAADQGRTVAGLARGLDGGPDLVGVMAVDVADHLPAVGFEALRGVVGEPAVDFAVDGDAVVVVEGDQLVQALGAGQGADFMGNAFHHAAIAEEHVGVVVDDVVAITVELRSQGLFGDGEADGVGEALTQRAGGGFHAGGVAVFRVARGAAAQLAEVLQVLDAEVVAGQVQQRVVQHRAVAVGQHEAVAVGPLGVVRVVLQVIPPEHFGDIGHSHGGAGVAAVGFLHRIHAQGTDGIGTLTTAGHRLSPAGLNRRLIEKRPLFSPSREVAGNHRWSQFHQSVVRKA